MPEKLVIVGAGQAATQAIDVLRRRGFDGSIVLVGDEAHEPYQRPPLSKKYLAGELAAERLLLRPRQFYPDHAVELCLGHRVLEIDRSRGYVRLDDGARIAYDKLLLATGGRPRQIDLPGANLEGVHCLRTIDDADRLRGELRPGQRLAVLGGGYIGLEVAATCRGLGLEVTVIEMAGRVMSRVVCEQVSAFFETQHARHDVNVVRNARVGGIVPAPGGKRAAGVRCDDGRIFPADVVLMCVGSVPSVELAAAAGLDCANGIVVDEFCRTSDARIYAAGDCTNHPSVRYGTRVRLESVDNAYEQGASAALNLLGSGAAHDRVPWFWSDQFDLKLVIVGLAHLGERTVVRGEPESGHFSVCYLRGDELVAVDTINSAKDQMAARKLIAARARVDPLRLRSVDVPLSACVVS